MRLSVFFFWYVYEYFLNKSFQYSPLIFFYNECNYAT
jgi:hypothetical protein